MIKWLARYFERIVERHSRYDSLYVATMMNDDINGMSGR